MDSILYIALGALDIMAILILTLRVFRWPFVAFWPELAGISVICAMEPYISRLVLHIPEWDMILQNLLLVILLRYVVKVNFYYALTLSIVGSLVYSEVAYAVFHMLIFTGFITATAAPTSSETYTMQLINQALAFLIAWLMYKLNLGFSYVSVPPHDSKKRMTGREKIQFTINIMAVIFIFLTMYLFLRYGELGTGVIMLLDLIALVTLLLLARRQDYA